MANHYGISGSDWNATRDEMRRLLVRRARRRGFYAYSELLDELQTIELSTDQPRDRGILTELLIEIGTAEHQAGRPLLTSIVVHRSGDQEPGDGFLKLAEELGLPVADRQQLWIEQFKATHRHWAA